MLQGYPGCSPVMRTAQLGLQVVRKLLQCMCGTRGVVSTGREASSLRELGPGWEQ